MKLISFRIQNYKSIKDSGECYLDKEITILAGKNGSGKSNVLEALSKFTNHNFDFSEDNYNYSDERPIIIARFELEDEEVVKICQKYDVGVEREVIVTLDTNSNDNFDYLVRNPIDTQSLIEHNLRVVHKVKKEIQEESIQYGNTIEEIVSGYEGELALTIRDALKSNGFADIGQIEIDVRDYILEIMPAFVYKKTIENELTSIITKESIKTNDFHKDIAKMLGISDVDFDQNADRNGRMRRGSNLSATLTGKFGTFYGQDSIKLNFVLDGDAITLGVVEPDKAYGMNENKIENKSDGLKWFIAFYVKLQVMKNKQLIILLDEPGMYLHAKACGEMLNIFSEIAKESQIIFATHNPYLIKANNIGAVRLIINEDKSTIIENKPHKYEQDKNMDVLTPILTSIGYELTMSIHVGDQRNNLITEGISDYYFLQGMAKILNKQLDYLIIPSSSADKINYIASILIGWGLNTIALLDSDKKGKTKQNELAPLVDKALCVSETKGLCIEDLFTANDYCVKILETQVAEGQLNSQVKKTQRIDEVLKSKQFWEMAKNNAIELEQETKDNFTKLFATIEEAFSNIDK